MADLILQVVPPKVRDALTPRLASVSPRGVESSNDLKRLLEEAQEVECAGKGEEAQAAKDEVQAAREEAQEALLAAKEEAQAAREEAQAAKKEVLRLMKELETRQGKLAALRGEVGSFMAQTNTREYSWKEEGGPRDVTGEARDGPRGRGMEKDRGWLEKCKSIQDDAQNE